MHHNNVQLFRMAVSPQWIIQYPIHFMFVSAGFRGRRIEWRYFRLDQIQQRNIGDARGVRLVTI